MSSSITNSISNTNCLCGNIDNNIFCINCNKGMCELCFKFKISSEPYFFICNFSFNFSKKTFMFQRMTSNKSIFSKMHDLL